MNRTEEQKVGKLPFELTLGAEKYQVKPLSVNQSRAWRAKLNEVMGPIADAHQQKSGVMSQVLANTLTEFPDKVAELLFAYAPELPREKVMNEASEEQLASAFCDLLVVAYPFLAPLALVVRLIRPTSPQ